MEHPPDTTYQAIHFINDSLGWLTTFTPILFKTTDSGVSWERILTPSYYNEIYFINDIEGWAGATTGEIYHSTDGGLTWSPQGCPMIGPVTELTFYDKNFGWLIGGSSILYTSSGGITSVEIFDNITYPSDFILYQNYPNPFNSTTKISFVLTIPTRRVEVFIYDILGNLIKTIAVDNPIVGLNIFDWEGEDDFGNTVSSGIYLYRLILNEFPTVKKMILIK